ncbi:MAG: c-type cytochrome [Roseomonas sp.]|nr:c-type cytochrome [Roseomonas sp.]
MKASPMIALRNLAFTLGALVVSSPAFASAELARSKNCVACHHAERRMIGPAYNLIAGRYANDSNAVSTLATRIIAGGGGNWGPMPMPAQPNVSREEAEALAAWIMSFR